MSSKSWSTPIAEPWALERLLSGDLTYTVKVAPTVGRVYPRPLIERFMAKVTMGAPDECWEWTGATTEFGHGKVAWRVRSGRHLIVQTHVVSFALANGRLAVGVVRHKCDNPPCVNPHHLEEGTQRDNILDSVRRGRYGDRSHTGTRNPRATMTDEDVVAIRRAYDGGERPVDIARRTGFSYQAVYKVARRTSWTHIIEDKRAIFEAAAIGLSPEAEENTVNALIESFKS